jgi:hypothetical protein
MLTLGLAVLALAAAPAVHAASIASYPSSQTIYATGPLPPAGATKVALNVAIGETEDAQIVVAGARNVSAAVDGQPLQPLITRLLFGHYVMFGSRKVPDALLPWDGKARPAEAANQPLWLQIGVPQGTPPGTYTGKVVVNADGIETSVPVSVHVFGVTVPPFTQLAGNMQTAFHLSAESYVNKVGNMFGLNNDQRIAANAALYKFLAEHRISPLSWGFGEPGATSSNGYERNERWWLDSATNMERQQQESGGFPVMRIPISNNRTSAHNYIGGRSPSQPQTWCDYLRSVHDFWNAHGWLSSLPYLYGQDEPGPPGQRLVGRQAAVTHRCFPGSRVLMTGNPTDKNRFLWDNRDGNDVDIWTVLSRRYYGEFSTPQGTRRSHTNLAYINKARSNGKTIWSYTYSGVAGSPGFSATEPLSDARVLTLWNSLEHVSGLLYGEGTTNYDKRNPFESVANNGDFILLYPGATEPVTSARLEQIRDGVEDWAIYDQVRKRHGIAAVHAILGGSGIFSASASGVKLGCTSYCDFVSSTKYSWPRWSHDSSTPRRIEAAKLKALQAASR